MIRTRKRKTLSGKRGVMVRKRKGRKTVRRFMGKRRIVVKRKFGVKRRTGRRINGAAYNQGFDAGFDEAYNEGFNVGFAEGTDQGNQMNEKVS